MSEQESHGGHGLDHDITVAALVTKIAESHSVSEKAWCSAMLHSVDRLVPEDQLKKVTISLAERLSDFFVAEEIAEIVETAMRHSELNQDNQSDTQITLMDADRLANMQMAVIIRGDQFRPTIPALEFSYLRGQKNPLSSYDEPRSVLDNIRFIISNYVPQLRLHQAKKLERVYEKRLTTYISAVEEDHQELDLIDLSI